jgi:hypothetical protein
VFDQLISFDPETETATPLIAAGPEGVTPVSECDPAVLAQAQRESAQWLAELGADDEEGIDAELGRKAARRAFTDLTVGEIPQKKVDSLLALRSPHAVAHLTGMLTAYDWEFVEQAKQLRGYVVARLLEEADPQTGGKAPDRIKALTALGKVTEVGLFTEKVEITKKDLSDEELDARIKDRMDRIRRVVETLPRPAGVTDVVPRDPT